MSGYRGLPDALRQQLLARRDAVLAQRRRLGPWDRRALAADLHSELEQLEEQLDSATSATAIRQVETLLTDYENAIEAAVLAARHRRDNLRRVLWVALVVFGIVGARIAYKLREYPDVADACRSHFHCGYDGRCSVGIFVNPTLGIDLECIAVDDGDCDQACRRHGRCTVVGRGCRATEQSHCRRAEDCRDHGRCSLVADDCRMSKP